MVRVALVIGSSPKFFTSMLTSICWPGKIVGFGPAGTPLIIIELAKASGSGI